MKQIRRAITGLVVVTILACSGAMLLLAWPAAGWKALVVPTGSMKPAIQPGSLVLVHHVSASSLKIGDVITYTNPHNEKQTITHRVAQINKSPQETQFITKGDANPAIDQPIQGGMIRGRVALDIPYFGSGVNWLRTWPGLIVLIYIPALAVIIEELRRLAKYYRSQQPYLAAGFIPSYAGSNGHSVRKATGVLAIPAVIVLAVAIPAHALLKSNSVSLAPNTLSVASVAPPNNCSGSTNTTNVNVNNTSNQTATTGNATNTSGGSATSGNASNSNNTNININVNNCR